MIDDIIQCSKCAAEGKNSQAVRVSICANNLPNPYSFVDENGQSHKHVWDHCISDYYQCQAESAHLLVIQRPIRPCPACGTKFVK